MDAVLDPVALYHEIMSTTINGLRKNLPKKNKEIKDLLDKTQGNRNCEGYIKGVSRLPRNKSFRSRCE